MTPTHIKPNIYDRAMVVTQFPRVRNTIWHLSYKYIRGGEMLQCSKVCIKRGNGAM